MSTISQPGQTSVKVPLTPIRRLLCKLKFGRPTFSLGKRNRDYLNGFMEPAFQVAAPASVATSARPSPGPRQEDSLPSSPTTSHHSSERARARVALQKDDEPFDAIVITTLPCYPFCCHEDLITMSRQQLIDVAVTLNTHLPRAIQIELSEALTDAHIRHSIETLIGIVSDTPGAPKPVRSWPSKSQAEPRQALLELESDSDTHLDILPSPPTSPLAARISRRRGYSLVGTPPRRLERLEEEDEGSPVSAERPLKKRKVAHGKATPIRFMYGYAGMDMDTSPVYNRALVLTSLPMLSSPQPMDEGVDSRSGDFSLDSFQRTGQAEDTRMDVG